MDTINDSIALALESGRPPRPTQVITARSCMTQHVVTVTPRQIIGDAMAVLLKHKISGAPVIEGNNRLVGMLSEIDCLRALACSSYDSSPFQHDRRVEELMSRRLITITPNVELFTMVRMFQEHAVRRLPVVEQEILVGQVSRRDLLHALQRLR